LSLVKQANIERNHFEVTINSDSLFKTEEAENEEEKIGAFE
jgi:hypothetical protein